MSLMNAKTIDLLSTYDPLYRGPRVTMSSIVASNKPNPFQATCRDRFLAKYTKPNFGYYIAKSMANARLRFPIALVGRDTWVFKAYLMLLDHDKYFNHHIVEAYHLSQFLSIAGELGSAIKAMLIACKFSETTEDHITAVADVMGAPRETIDAFESLFFNVLDRREDSLFIAKEVYPDSRLVEFDPNYMMNTPYTDIIKRVAYNHRDIDMTSYLIGIGDQTYFKKMAGRTDRESELAKLIMGNGLLMTHTNLMNQHSVGLSRASTLLAASRQSGNTSEEPAIAGMESFYNLDFEKAIGTNRDVSRAQIRKDAGDRIVIDIP